MESQLAFWIMFTLGSTFGMGIPFLVWARRNRQERDLELELYDMDETGANNSGVQTGVMPGNKTVGRVGERSNEPLPLVPSNFSVVLEESIESLPDSCPTCGLTGKGLGEHLEETRHGRDNSGFDDWRKVAPTELSIGVAPVLCDVCHEPVGQLQRVGKTLQVRHSHHNIPQGAAIV